MSGPLEGLKVLDIATIVAGPFAASLLADYGADVVKVELPGVGDGMRGFPPFKEGKSLWWKATNRNKRLLTLDIRKPEGREIFKKMLPEFDVLVENFRPGTLESWGLSRETLWALQPRLVILRVTGFGQDGPYRERPGFARIFEAMGGLAYISGESAREPIHAGYPIGDPLGGVFGAVGVLAALWRIAKDPQAKGEEIDLALTEAVFRLLEILPAEYDQLGVVRERAGNANKYSAPSGVYRTLDGRYVSMAGSTQPIFEANASAIGRTDLISHPDYVKNADRVKNAAEIEAIFREWMSRHTCDEVLSAFEQAGGAIAPVYSMDQIAQDPQFAHRQMMVAAQDCDFGTVCLPNVVPRFSGNPGEVRHTAGNMGEANQDIYRALGYSADELETLRAMKVI